MNLIIITVSDLVKADPGSIIDNLGFKRVGDYDNPIIVLNKQNAFNGERAEKPIIVIIKDSLSENENVEKYLIDNITESKNTYFGYHKSGALINLINNQDPLFLKVISKGYSRLGDDHLYETIKGFSEIVKKNKGLKKPLFCDSDIDKVITAFNYDNELEDELKEWHSNFGDDFRNNIKNII